MSLHNKWNAASKICTCGVLVHQERWLLSIATRTAKSRYQFSVYIFIGNCMFIWSEHPKVWIAMSQLGKSRRYWLTRTVIKMEDPVMSRMACTISLCTAFSCGEKQLYSLSLVYPAHHMVVFTGSDLAANRHCVLWPQLQVMCPIYFRVTLCFQPCSISKHTVCILARWL